MSDSWKLTLPCTRAEAEAIDESDDLGISPPPVLMTTEEIEDDVEAWRLDAYFEGEPGADAVTAVRTLVPSAAGIAAVPVVVADADWVTMSQAGLEPVRAGRFFVHTSAYTGPIPRGVRPFLIEAGQAFGTGHHETTAGCLTMLDAMAGERFGNVIDLGTGTGLLAFAALDLCPQARATATDIDPIAITVTRENAGANGVAIGEREGEVALVVADGTADAAIGERAPYDLVISNILAGPLIEMAADVTAIAAPGATIVLAGLLTTQADTVAAAYAACGAVEAERLTRGDWAILRLRAGGGR